MKKTLLFSMMILVAFAGFAQSEAIHYDVNPKYPRYATETDYKLLSGLQKSTRDVTPPPSPVNAISEFQPMGGVMIAYPLGIPVSLVRELANITNVKVIVSSAADSNQAKNYFSSSQVNMQNVNFWLIPHDSYWVRDYGPWFVLNGNDSIGIVDFIYNRPSRPKDDAALEYIVDYLGVNRYEMAMVHTGGNYMVDGYGTAASTMLVEQENPNETINSLNAMANEYLGIDNYMFLPDPLGEYIAHIDCWGKFLDVDKVLIAKVSASDPRYSNYEEVAETFAQSLTPWGNHYKVYRVFENPNANSATPYTNSLIINDHVFVPVAGNSHDDEAIAVYQEAMPGYTIVPIMQSMFTPWFSTDALHCRTHELADLGMLYIKHYPLLGEKTLADPLTVNAEIKSLNGSELITDSTVIFYSINSGDWQQQSLTSAGNSTYTFDFSQLSLTEGDNVKYYISAKDGSGRKEKHPYIGSADPHEFSIKAVGVEDYTFANVFVYPNPTENYVNIRFEKENIFTNISVLDLQGRCLISENNSGQTFATVDISSLTSGIYLLQLSDKNGNKLNKKIVKK